VKYLFRVVDPVLQAGARGGLAAEVPLSLSRQSNRNRHAYRVLEALSRVLLGISPWLESSHPLPDEELALRDKYRALAVASLNHLELADFTPGFFIQSETGFLSAALLRAPKELWAKVSPSARATIVQGLRHVLATHSPVLNNWLWFRASSEAFLIKNGFETPLNGTGVLKAFQRFNLWYLGEGMYSDGPAFHFDYYNSFVVHPLAMDVSFALNGTHWIDSSWLDLFLRRAQMFGVVLERMVSPEGAAFTCISPANAANVASAGRNHASDGPLARISHRSAPRPRLSCLEGQALEQARICEERDGRRDAPTVGQPRAIQRAGLARCGAGWTAAQHDGVVHCVGQSVPGFHVLLAPRPGLVVGILDPSRQHVEHQTGVRGGHLRQKHVLLQSGGCIDMDACLETGEVWHARRRAERFPPKHHCAGNTGVSSRQVPGSGHVGG
jgi:hypothetical protein